MNPWRWLDEPICDYPVMGREPLGNVHVVIEGHTDPEPVRVPLELFDGYPDVIDHFAGVEFEDWWADATSPSRPKSGPLHTANHNGTRAATGSGPGHY